MKNIFSLLILSIILSQSCFSQEKFDWNRIQKIELYSFEKNNKCGQLTAKDLNRKTLVKCETADIIKHLKELKKFEYDAIIEQQCYALRVYFDKSHTDFLVFLSQGVIFKMRNPKEFYQIVRKEEFKKLLENLTKKKDL